jgi:hypothetical protein
VLGIQPAGEQLALGGICGEREGSLVGVPGLCRPAGGREKLGPHRVKQPVVVKVCGNRLELGERRPRPDGESRRDRKVQQDDR